MWLDEGAISALDAESRLRKNGAVYFTQATFKSAIIRYTDAATTDGYFDISRLFIGNYFEFQYQFPDFCNTRTRRYYIKSLKILSIVI